jgi:MoxR-like ATPase
MASQNPIELEGTYPLPEAQLDRFLFKLLVTNLETNVLQEIISTRRHGNLPTPSFHLEKEQLLQIFAAVDKIEISSHIAQYIARLVSATHPTDEEAPESVKQHIAYGASPRAAIAIAEAARSHAFIFGNAGESKPVVGFDNVRAVTPWVLNHRLILNYKARVDRVTSLDVISELLQLPITKIERSLEKKGITIQGISS